MNAHLLLPHPRAYLQAICCLMLAGSTWTVSAQSTPRLLTENYRAQEKNVQRQVVSLRETIRQLEQQHRIKINYQDKSIAQQATGSPAGETFVGGRSARLSGGNQSHDANP